VPEAYYSLGVCSMANRKTDSIARCGVVDPHPRSGYRDRRSYYQFLIKKEQSPLCSRLPFPLTIPIFTLCLNPSEHPPFENLHSYTLPVIPFAVASQLGRRRRLNSDCNSCLYCPLIHRPHQFCRSTLS